jgi:release factor glutamine methyltransferase
MAYHYRDLVLETSDDVYVPAEDSELLANHVRASGHVLDIGTGSGIQALAAAKGAERVLGIDVNPKAVELATRNAKSNGITNAEFRLSDMFSNVEGRFDTVIFNPPYLPVSEVGDLERSWSGGRMGRELIDRFIGVVKEHLNPGATIYLLVSSLNEPEHVIQELRSRGFEAEVIATDGLFFEELHVLSAVFKRR